MFFRWYILGKHSSTVFTINKNTNESVDEQNLAKPLELETEICLSQNLLENVVQNVPDVTKDPTDEIPELCAFTEPVYQYCSTSDEISEEHENLLATFETFNINETIRSEGLKYITGYVAFRFRDKYNLGTPSRDMKIQNMPDWVQFISRGSLLYPNMALINAANIMEEQFCQMHGNFLSKEKNIFNILADKIIEKLIDTLPREIILCLVRTRTYIRLREINKNISMHNYKRKFDRKISKFTNTKK